MSARPLPRVFGLLASERSRAADDALIDALPHLDDDARAAAIDLLVKRARPDCLAKVVVGLGGFGESLRSAVLGRLRDFHAGLRAAVDSAAFDDRAAAIDAIVAAADYSSVYLLADALRAHCPRTRERAAAAVRRLTAALLDRRRGGVTPGDARQYHADLDRLAAVGNAVLQYWDSHLRPEALEAALWMIDRVEPALLKAVAQPQSRILRGLGEILERTADPRLAGFVLRALAIPELRPAAAEAIARARDPKFMEAVIDESWLLGDPAIGHACRHVRDAAPFRDWIVATAGLDARLAARTVRCIDATGGPRELALAILRELSTSESVEVRTAVVWRLVEDESPAAADLLATIAARAHDHVGEIAARECRRRAPSSPAATAASRAAPAPSAADRAFDRFFAEFDRLAPAERRDLAGELSGAVPDIPDRLAARLDAASPLDRVTALKLVAAFGAAAPLAQRVYAAAHDADALVRAAATSLLADLADATARRLLRAAINDADARVQAAAIEALERLDAAANAAPIRDKLASPDNRVRANAIKALMRVELESAAPALLAMLGEPSHAHRISALWVVERLRLQNILDRVATMTQNDPDARVRARARRVMRSFAAGSESRRIGRAAPTQGGPA